jgi:hypothetical protein
LVLQLPSFQFSGLSREAFSFPKKLGFTRRRDLGFCFLQALGSPQFLVMILVHYKKLIFKIFLIITLKYPKLLKKSFFFKNIFAPGKQTVA